MFKHLSSVAQFISVIIQIYMDSSIIYRFEEENRKGPTYVAQPDGDHIVIDVIDSRSKTRI